MDFAKRSIQHPVFAEHLVVHIAGGLANQMFQYAAGRALSLRLKVPLCLNISAFSRKAQREAHVAWRLPLFPGVLASVSHIDAAPPPKLHNYLRRVNLFVQKRLCSPFPLFSSVVTEPHFSYWPGIAHVTASAHLYGYWQSEKYFLDCAEQIRKDFTFLALPEGAASALAARIAACPDAVSVHIRRGDYVSNPAAFAFHGLPGPRYYSAALAHIHTHVGNAKLFLFSDDPQWVQDNFDPCGHACEIVNLALPEAPQHDMHLMSLCRHHIIANSSFSWWAAWLGSPGGITIAPERWFAASGIDTSDICPPAWVRL